MLKPFYHPDRMEAGCDEAGRGCLAGPVVAAAVILPATFQLTNLNDSKKLSEKKRNALRVEIEKVAVSYAVAFIDNLKIDEINILNASFLAMHLALDELNKKFNHILVDGNRFTPYRKVDHRCIIQGDGKYASIAAASILAKTYRDEYMEKMHLKFPEYGWISNKGYPTKAHRKAIEQNGITELHRKSFQLLPRL